MRERRTPITFQELNLHPQLLKAVESLGWAEPTPIQAQAIPIALQGRDVLGGAQTGSGKTAAFVLPILHKLLHSPSHGMKALVLVPTRELAMQVLEAVQDCGKFTNIKAGAVIGGVGYGAQRQSFSQGTPIQVATPGRFLDHLRQHSMKVEGVETLVLDEADRMLDMGFIHDIRR
ncbi:MAG: DEAD/DEAH box helicase, partial [Elusimicrobia bacterium]|nr:DEAD/DEAH box helicase [Elusimicrobiota bacterium]